MRTSPGCWSASTPTRAAQATDEADRAELADAASAAARRAEPLELAGFPALERALRRRGGRDALYFEIIAEELRGDRAPDSLGRQDVDADTIRNLREFHLNVLQEAIDLAEQHARDLEAGDGRRRAQRWV